MKRKVLCFFSFLLILLVFCTLVSPKAEEEMRTLVKGKHAYAKGIRNASVGNIAIVWRNSNKVLYNIVEGDGWESGLRIAEIPDRYYDRHEGHVELGTGTDYWYIKSASREPVAGAPITLVEELQKGDDVYLLWCPEVITGLDKLPNSMDVLSQANNAALISMRSAIFPFFEHNIWYSLHEKMGDDLRVYSLHDVSTFLEALPWIAGVGAVLICSLILCAASWILYGKMGRKKGILWLNILLIAGLFSALPWLLSQFDLPASLMPVDSILNVSHYLTEFSRIFATLEILGEEAVLALQGQMLTQSAVLIVCCIVAAAAVIAVEAVFLRRKRVKQTN